MQMAVALIIPFQCHDMVTEGTKRLKDSEKFLDYLP
jgi:hypothetical protein